MQKINEISAAGQEYKTNAIQRVKDFFKGNNDKGSNYLGGSISQYSKNLIMTFPVLCDNSLTPDTASMICKANERNVTTMLQLLFTAMNIEANNGMKVLSQVHNNIKTNMDVYEVMDKMDDIAAGLEKAGNLVKTFESVETSKGFMSEKEAIREMTFELKNKTYNKSFPVESLSEKSLNRFTITRGYNNIIIKEDNDNQKRYNYDPEKENINAKIYNILYDEYEKGHGWKIDTKNYYDYLHSPEFTNKINFVISQLNLDTVVSDKQRKEIQEEIIKMFEEDLERKNLKLKNFEMEKDNIVKLVDTDVKKANELQPTVLQINYSERKENGDVELRTFLAGVKSRLVAVSSSDMIDRLIAKNRTKINFLNFIRATTGEIGFFKDFLFAVDQAKLDSKNAVKKGEAAQIWNCLAARAAKNNKNKLKKLGNDASAITVIAVSQETVNYMKSVHKFDLEKMSNTKMICDAYNLMGIIIADESIEVVKSYYVGNNGYEQIAYSFLEKENKNSDYKKVVNLMSQMNTR
jgi:hypothetical protein